MSTIPAPVMSTVSGGQSRTSGRLSNQQNRPIAISSTSVGANTRQHVLLEPKVVLTRCASWPSLLSSESSTVVRNRVNLQSTTPNRPTRLPVQFKSCPKSASARQTTASAQSSITMRSSIHSPSPRRDTRCDTNGESMSSSSNIEKRVAVPENIQSPLSSSVQPVLDLSSDTKSNAINSPKVISQRRLAVWPKAVIGKTSPPVSQPSSSKAQKNTAKNKKQTGLIKAAALLPKRAKPPKKLPTTPVKQSKRILVKILKKALIGINDDATRKQLSMVPKVVLSRCDSLASLLSSESSTVLRNHVNLQSTTPNRPTRSSQPFS